MLVNNKLTNSRNNRQSCQVDWFTRGSEGEKSKGMKAPKENQKVIRECWTEKEASWVGRNQPLIRDSTHWAILQNAFPQMLRYWNTLFRATSLAWTRPHVWPSARDKLNIGHSWTHKNTQGAAWYLSPDFSVPTLSPISEQNLCVAGFCRGRLWVPRYNQNADRGNANAIQLPFIVRKDTWG